MMVHTREIGDVVILEIEGDIKRSLEVAAPTLHAVVKARLEAGWSKILLNFEKAGIVDSFGVGEILASHISTVNVGGVLRQASISQRLSLIYDITKLKDVFNVHLTVDDALAAFSRG